MSNQLKTGLILLIALVGLIGYDIYMVIHDSSADISHIMDSVFTNARFSLFLFGYVCGHLTWPLVNIARGKS